MNYEEMWEELKAYLEERDSELLELFHINEDSKFAWRVAELRNVITIMEVLEDGE